MKVVGSLLVTAIASLAIAGTTLAQSIEEAAVFQLSSHINIDEVVPIGSNDDGLLYLADKFEVSDFYDLSEESIKFLSSVYQREEQEEGKKSKAKAKVIALINGVSNPSEFFSKHELKPIFKLSNNDEENLKLIETIYQKFPRQFSTLNDDEVELNKLTQEMKFITSSGSKEGSKEGELIQHFKFFNAKLNKIWKSFKSQFTHQQVMDSSYVNPATLRLINDKLFINELSQLVHLSEINLSNAKDQIFLNFDSLLSLGNKIGTDASTFQFSSHVLSDYLIKLSKEYDVTVLAIPMTRTNVLVNQRKLNKRSREIESIFATREGASSDSASSFFASEEECQVATDNCNSHGVCSKVSSKSWTCLCSPTFDKKKGKTTTWTGFDCSKKDISSQANLLLWTSLSLIVLIFGGINLLYSIGLDPLPGVLDAATSVKKSA